MSAEKTGEAGCMCLSQAKRRSAPKSGRFVRLTDETVYRRIGPARRWGWEGAEVPSMTATLPRDE